MNIINMFISSTLAGIAIAIGAIVYLVTGNALFFPIGLLIVIMYNLCLYTGRVGYISEFNHFPKLLLMLLGNMIGAFATGFITRYCKPALIGNASDLCQRKMIERLGLIPLAILCGALVFIAVDICKHNEVDAVPKMVAVWMATTTFVVCGFEHCIANTFYFALAGKYTWSVLLYILFNALFNGVGCVLAHILLYHVQEDASQF